MVHFGEFLKTWSLRSNSVTRKVNFNRTKIGGKCQDSNATFWVIFKQCELIFFCFSYDILGVTSSDCLWDGELWDDVGGFSRVYHSTQLGSICRSLYFLKAALILSCWRQSQSLIRFWKAEETRRWLTLTDYPKLVACPMKLSSVV